MGRRRPSAKLYVFWLQDYSGAWVLQTFTHKVDAVYFHSKIGKRSQVTKIVVYTRAKFLGGK